MKLYRKMYKNLNEFIKTTEVLECSGRYREIDFNNVPDKCLKIK